VEWLFALADLPFELADLPLVLPGLPFAVLAPLADQRAAGRLFAPLRDPLVGLAAERPSVAGRRAVRLAPCEGFRSRE